MNIATELLNGKKIQKLALGAVAAAVAVSALFLSGGSSADALFLNTCGGNLATKVGTEGSDVIYGTEGRDVIVGKGGNDSIIGKGGDDVICGGAGVDQISGDAGADIIDGGDDFDQIFGGAEADNLYGGNGDDMITPGPGFVRDWVDGGVGRDIVKFHDATTPVVVDLVADTANGQGFDGLPSIESASGSAYGDSIYGDDSANTLQGGGGSDRLFGRGGNDALYGEAGSDTLDGGLATDTCTGETEINCEADEGPGPF
jgi:Ca2+-binding RTX toxin-like protein